MAYKKNYAPKSRQEVAGANDHLWIPEMQKWPADRKKYNENYNRIFGEKSLNVWPRDANGDLIDD